MSLLEDAGNEVVGRLLSPPTAELTSKSELCGCFTARSGEIQGFKE